MPKISVVLPVYNGERFLRESIDSILNQTFCDWELIIVNDCSTDGTRQIAEEYVSKDQRIFLINNVQNLKLPGSLNIGFRKAKGQYLTWTSDDNLYLPEAFEEMAAYLDKADFPMVCANMEIINEEGAITGIFPKYNKEQMIHNDRVGACFMYRRDVLEKIGEYDPEWFLVEDYEYWLRIYYECGEIGHIDTVLYRYRDHDGSLTNTRLKDIKAQLHRLRIAYIEHICRELKDNVNLLFQVYVEMMHMDASGAGYRDVFCQTIPAFAIVEPFKSTEPTAIFGAGDYGNRAFRKIGENVLNYVDTNPEKVGLFYNGKEIISLDDFLERQKEMQLLVALFDGKIGEAILQLYESGIQSCSVYQLLAGVFNY